MLESSILTLFTASAILADSVIPQIGPRQRDDVVYLYSSVEAARDGTTFETDFNTWESAVKTPNMTAFDDLRGPDITKSYLERNQSMWDYSMDLSIVADYPLPLDAREGNDPRFTTITSVWLTVPRQLEGRQGIPRSIDPSWNPCFGYFYFDHDLDPADDFGDLEEPCSGYLSNNSQQCVDNITAWLAEEFQANDACPFQNDDNLASDKLPDSCEKVTDSQLVTFLGKYLRERLPRLTSLIGGPWVDLGPSSDLPIERVFGIRPEGGFGIGTGSNEEGDEQAYRTSGLRTVLVAGVWGYNINDTSLESEELDAPLVTISCLRGRRGLAAGSSLPEEVGAAGSSFRISSWGLLMLPVMVATFL